MSKVFCLYSTVEQKQITYLVKMTHMLNQFSLMKISVQEKQEFQCEKNKSRS